MQKTIKKINAQLIDFASLTSEEVDFRKNTHNSIKEYFY